MASENINIYDDLTNNGGNITVLGQISMIGTSNQTISGTLSVPNLYINNANGVTLAAGADFVMAGSLFAGTNNTPGEVIKTKNGDFTWR